MDSNMSRIELHCHSFNGGNSTMYPGEIMRYLSNMGMPAFAITDESSILSCVELEEVWKTGNYTARPIYGIEFKTKGVFDGDVDYMSLLIRNESGKKAIFRIISENDSEEIFPLFSFDKIIEKRDGFLLGSGTDKGRLYKYVIAGKSDEELKKEMSYYDYIELLPYEKYKEYNKKLIALSDELNIPAIAVSDARYNEETGRLVIKIIRHWNNECEDIPDNHFWSTEEMLKAFNYLPEKKAWEIVVENTHLIADKCETVPIKPKENLYPQIPGAGEIIKNRCYNKLKEKYPESFDEAKKQLDWELQAFKNTHKETYILHMSELLKKMSLKPDEVIYWGAGSIVAYLLEISNIDPIKYGLRPEIVFGIDGKYIPRYAMDFPFSIAPEVPGNIEKLEGVGKCVYEGHIIGVNSKVASDMIQKYVKDFNKDYDEEFIDKLMNFLKGNICGRILIHKSLVLPEGYECKENMPVVKVPGGQEVPYIDPWDIFINYNYRARTSMDLLYKLEKLTGISVSDVPAESEEALKLFKVDKDGNAPGCTDLTLFPSEDDIELLTALKPESFNDIVKLYAVINAGYYKMHAIHERVRNNKDTIDDIISTIDDIFDYCLSLGIDKNTAYEMAVSVNKGLISRGKSAKWRKWKKMLIEAGASENFIWYVENLCYLLRKGGAIAEVIAGMRLGWFKVHYPDEFNLVIKEQREQQELLRH